MRNKIIKIIKENEKGIKTNKIKEKLKDKNINKEIAKLLKEGFIFEAKPDILKWLG